MKTKKILVAGPLVKEVLYDRVAPREGARIRQQKRKASSEAQQRLNARLSWEKLELMLAANFVPGDLVVTLTYDDAHLPKDRAAALARLKRFREQMTKARRRRGKDLRMIWATENAHEFGRWHHHVVLNAAGGKDFSEILGAWPYGTNVEIRKLQIDREKNYESLARYMAKEARERPGLRSWSTTRNCRKPETETFRVTDDTVLRPPDGVIVVAEEARRTEFASWAFVKYLAVSPQQMRHLLPKSRRRR